MFKEYFKKREKKVKAQKLARRIAAKRKYYAACLNEIRKTKNLGRMKYILECMDIEWQNNYPCIEYGNDMSFIKITLKGGWEYRVSKPDRSYITNKALIVKAVKKIIKFNLNKEIGIVD